MKRARKCALEELGLKSTKVSAHQSSGTFAPIDYKTVYKMDDNQYQKFSDVILSVLTGQKQQKSKPTKRSRAGEKNPPLPASNASANKTSATLSDGQPAIDDEI